MLAEMEVEAEWSDLKISFCIELVWRKNVL